MAIDLAARAAPDDAATPSHCIVGFGNRHSAMNSDWPKEKLGATCNLAIASRTSPAQSMNFRKEAGGGRTDVRA